MQRYAFYSNLEPYFLMSFIFFVAKENETKESLAEKK
jgi:hypothetical protein